MAHLTSSKLNGEEVMGRSPCCDADANVKKGPWTPEEDKKLMDYIEKHGHSSWRHLPKHAGLNRCGKSCRLRWTNYLRSDIKRGKFSQEEEQLVIQLHSVLGNKWSTIAARLPGRTDNEIKNYWNTNLRKKLLTMGIDPVTHRPRTDLNILANLPNLIAAANFSNMMTNPLVNSLQLPNLQLLQSVLQVINNASTPNMGALSQWGSPFLNQNLLPLNPSINGGDHLIAAMNYGSSLNDHGVLESSSNCGSDSATNSYMTTPISNSTPSLVAASPEIGTVDKVQNLVNSSDVATDPTTSTPFADWDGLTLDGLDNDFGWKDILDQISWSDAL